MQRRTERIWLDNNFNLKQLSRASKNLYNYANYIFKKQLEYNHYTSEYEMMDIVRYHPTYQALPAHSSQQIIKSLVKSWKSYFKAIKEYKRKQNKFLGKPRSPKYKRKNGFHTIFFTSDQVKIRDGFVIFPKKLGLKIQTRLDKKIKAARILPRNDQFLLELIYEIEVPDTKPALNVAGVDLGVNNLIASVSNRSRPVIVRGRKLKSINQWFNKEKARLQSIYKKGGFWAEGMTSSRGWIVIALVIVALWHPVLAVFGAYIFGIFYVFQFRFQAGINFFGNIVTVPIQFLNMLPFLSTLLFLIIWSVILGQSKVKRVIGAPSALTVPFTDD